jgi:hypothetical protein
VAGGEDIRIVAVYILSTYKNREEFPQPPSVSRERP